MEENQEYELYMDIEAEENEFTALVSAFLYEVDPDEIQLGVVTGYSIHALFAKAQTLAEAFGYRLNGEWYWSKGHEAFRVMAIKPAEKGPEEITINGKLYRRAEE